MPEGRQIQHHGEAIVLRTWPFHEADLLVSLFTRDQGKVKGVARHALKSRRRFGGALEPATQVRAHYTERPKQDLVRLDQFEILWSPLTAPIDYLRTAALQLITEVLEEAMPDQAPEDNIYRLAVTVLTNLRSENVYLPTSLLLPLDEPPHGLDARARPLRRLRSRSPRPDRLLVPHRRRRNLLRRPPPPIPRPHRSLRRRKRTHLPHPPRRPPHEPWPPTRSADLRAFAIATLERHLERRLRSATALLAP